MSAARGLVGTLRSINEFTSSDSSSFYIEVDKENEVVNMAMNCVPEHIHKLRNHTLKDEGGIEISTT